MTLANYFTLFSQFFFKKTPTFVFRLGPDKVSVSVSSAASALPISIGFSQALQLVSLIAGNATTAPFTAGFVVDGTIEVNVTISKI
jgi:hypothetical protein